MTDIKIRIIVPDDYDSQSVKLAVGEPLETIKESDLLNENNNSFSFASFNAPKIESEPCIMQSAFTFQNGKRIIIYTGSDKKINSFECDEKWKPFKKPFATGEILNNQTQREYHESVRNIHRPEDFIPEYSSIIDV